METWQTQRNFNIYQLLWFEQYGTRVSTPMPFLVATSWVKLGQLGGGHPRFAMFSINTYVLQA